jgi:O-antigen/teichoic acid export membrane protein
MQRLNLGLYEVRSYNKMEVINRGCALALIGIVILSRRISPETIITANLVALTVGCFWALRNMRPYCLSSFPWPSWKLLRQHLSLGVKAYFITALSFLHMRVALLMVKYMLGPQQAGYYSVASGLGDYILMLPGVIGLVLFPKLSAIVSVPEKLRQTKSVVLGTALALIPLLTATVILAKPAVRILFGRPFMPAADVFLWLVPGIFMIGVEGATVQFLNSEGYPKILVGVWVSSIVVDVLLNLWAIPHFGIRGAALVTSISNTAALIGVLLIIRLRYSGSSEKLQVKAVA